MNWDKLQIAIITCTEFDGEYRIYPVYLDKQDGQKSVVTDQTPPNAVSDQSSLFAIHPAVLDARTACKNETAYQPKSYFGSIVYNLALVYIH